MAVKPTRGQVKRALEWADWSALKPRQREAKGAVFPKCLTCGAGSTFTYRPGEPAFECRHEPIYIDGETMERARETL